MNRKRIAVRLTALVLMLVWICSMTVFAEEGYSGDNSLASLGILTEGAVIEPEFYYSTIEYDVTVPAGTTQVALDPKTSHPNASIVDISGTELKDGKTTVTITVSAEDGTKCGYYLYVVEEAPAVVETEPVTEAPKKKKKETEKETEPETEDPRYVKVDRSSLEEAENTIAKLKAETTNYRDRLNLLMKILYGLIGFCVLLLFAVINLLLKNRDLKSDLKEYMKMSYDYYPEDGQQGEMNYDGYTDGYSQGNTEGYQEGYPEGYSNEAYGYDGYDMMQGDPNMDPYMGNTMPENGMYDQMPEEMPVQEMPQQENIDIPRPQNARRVERRMPEYEQPAQAPNPEFQRLPRDTKSKDVEVTMIDL